jgi:hypothetical protein
MDLVAFNFEKTRDSVTAQSMSIAVLRHGSQQVHVKKSQARQLNDYSALRQALTATGNDAHHGDSSVWYKRWLQSWVNVTAWQNCEFQSVPKGMKFHTISVETCWNTHWTSARNPLGQGPPFHFSDLWPDKCNPCILQDVVCKTLQDSDLSLPTFG